MLSGKNIVCGILLNLKFSSHLTGILILFNTKYKAAVVFHLQCIFFTFYKKQKEAGGKKPVKIKVNR